MIISSAIAANYISNSVAKKYQHRGGEEVEEQLGVAEKRARGPRRAASTAPTCSSSTEFSSLFYSYSPKMFLWSCRSKRQHQDLWLWPKCFASTSWGMIMIWLNFVLHKSPVVQFTESFALPLSEWWIAAHNIWQPQFKMLKSSGLIIQDSLRCSNLQGW
jgi:hypothetical protein